MVFVPGTGDPATRGQGVVWSKSMKAVVTALALASLVATSLAATSAFAKDKKSIPPQAAAAQASMPERQTAAAYNSYDVVVGGRVIGHDPDPAIRSDLLRQGDPTMQNGT
jgi:hypothetical protein